VAYASLLEEQRRALHARIIGAIERLYPDRLAEQAKALAVHAVRGEVWDKALDYCREVGAKDLGRRAYGEARTAYEHAIEALGYLTARPDAALLAVDFRCALASILNLQLQFERSRTLLDEAEALARQLDDPTLLLSVLGVMSSARRDGGDADGAIAAAAEAVEIAGRLRDAVAQATASYRLGQAFESIGEFRQAAALFRGNVEALAEGAPDPAPRWDWATLDRVQVLSASHAWLARALSPLGEFVKARHHGEEAMRLATATQGMSLIAAHACLGLVHVAQGDFTAGIPVLESELALCRAGDEKNWLSFIAGSLGEAYARVGRLADSVTLLERESGDAFEPSGLWHEAVLSRRLGTVYLLAARLDDARRHMRHALEAARQRNRRGHEAAVLFTVGEVHAESSPPEIQPAETSYHEALVLAEPRGMRPLVAHCHLGLGKLYRRTGKREQAREHLATAITMYRQMDMTYWSAQAEAELGDLR